MIKIGITGGIGSGKTTVCKIFELLRVPVFYADAVAKTIMFTNNELKGSIISAFGAESYSTDGSLNRKHLASIVFNNPVRLNILNSLVHPAVFKAFDVWASEQKFPYVIKEAALLFESKSYTLCDYSILVKSPMQLKIERIIKRDGISADEVRLRMNRQLADEEKENLCDYVILNDEKSLVISQVLELHEQFLNLSR